MSPKSKTLWMISLLIYACMVSFFIAKAIEVDQQALSSNLEYGHISDLARYFLWWLGAYYLRFGILLAPLLLSNSAWHTVTRYGINAVIVPEVLLFIWAFYLSFASPSASNEAGYLGLLIVLISVGIATIQSIGMIVGSIVAVRRVRQQSAT